MIAYIVPADAGNAPIRISIHDACGRLVRLLVDRAQSPGRHFVSWNGRDDNGRTMPSGIYTFRVNLGSAQQVYRMCVIR